MNYLPLYELTYQLSFGERNIIERVRLAIERPNLYYEEYSEHLVDRSIDKLSESLPWIALVDALLDNDLAIEIDWKESTSSIIEGVEFLLQQRNLDSLDWSFLDNYSDELPTNKVLNIISLKLLQNSISLSYLDINSDSYVLIPVPMDKIEIMKKLAATAGYKICDEFQ